MKEVVISDRQGWWNFCEKYAKALSVLPHYEEWKSESFQWLTPTSKQEMDNK